MPNLDVIAFDCPRCLHNLRVAKDQAGSRIDCPKCEMSLTVPSQAADAGLFDDLFDSSPAASSPPPATGKAVDPADSSSGLLVDSERSSGTTESAALDNPLMNLVDEQNQEAGPEKKPQGKRSPPVHDSDPLAGLVIPGSVDASETVKPGEEVENDPFVVDPDAPLKVDGVGDLFSNADVFGTKCHVCDTRIHVRPKQIGTEVECPICYSKVKIAAPEEKDSLRWGEKGKSGDDSKAGKAKKAKSHIAPDDELKLSAPVERPKVEIDPSWGLAPVENDLLAPKPKTIQELDAAGRSFEDIPELIVESGQGAGAGDSQGLSPPATKPKPKKAAKKKKAAAESGSASQSETKIARPRQRVSSSEELKDFPGFELMELFGEAVEMVKSPGVLLRVAIAFALMCLGAISMEWISPVYYEVVEDAEASMITRIVSAAKWLVAAAVYLLGLGVLWWTSGCLFRDAALGKRRVAKWSTAGTNEFLSTFLLFAFGFFIGGLPAAFFSLIIMPLRFLLGPLFLLSAWYNQSPFAIVSVDAFQSVSQNADQWKRFYVFVGGLAFLGFVAGIIFWMRAGLPFALGIPVIMLGIAICTVITLLFAVACGWHCGRVVESLENPE